MPATVENGVMLSRFLFQTLLLSLLGALTVSTYVWTKYRDDTLTMDQPAQAARLISSDVDALRATVRESMLVSEISTFSVVEKTPFFMLRVQQSSFVDGKLAFSVYNIDYYCRKAVSQTVVSLKTEWANFA